MTEHLTSREIILLRLLQQALGLLEQAPASGDYLRRLNGVYHHGVKLVHRLNPASVGRWMRDAPMISDDDATWVNPVTGEREPDPSRYGGSDASDELLRGSKEVMATLDLDTWTETAGAGSVDAVICPHCQAKYAPGQYPPRDGHFDCELCRQRFAVRVIDTPMGRAYMTTAEGGAP